ncbi:hypothetical protein [Actinomyces ruminicola]|uniref:Uncharacterized protein n=1 Tax=Actinomyces ruminicola TaxID=332524 RepID=A0A1H0AD74_9ACTO|nr:hypothetical protein [Actinomyces ruminicola]SDN31568.1 hypothetical protein SAMN04487766_1246 [Actinomyces ruminicola]
MADRYPSAGASQWGARTITPSASSSGDDDGVQAPAPDVYADSLLVRTSAIIYQAAALGVGSLPLVMPAAAGMFILDGTSAWSLLVLALTWALALTALPAVVYAVTRPGWTYDPSARRRVAALWRGWAGSIAQFGPIAALVVMLALGLAGSAAGISGGMRGALLSFLAVLGLAAGRAGTIVGLFSFKTADLLVLTAVMTIRDAAGTLFLAGIGAAGLLIALHAPATLMLAWVPLCALTAPATRGQRRILTEQFTRPCENSSLEA